MRNMSASDAVKPRKGESMETIVKSYKCDKCAMEWTDSDLAHTLCTISIVGSYPNAVPDFIRMDKSYCEVCYPLVVTAITAAV